jgi:ATP-dependent exoDNAse (exonuclease V) alpha subunit
LWIVANPVSNLARFVLATSVMGAAASALPGIVLVWLVGRERAGAAPTGAAASEA